MPGLQELTGEMIHGICTEKSGAIAESLNACFGTTHAVSCGEATPWNADDVPAGVTGPGLISALEVDGQAMLVLTPATLPLPEWWRTPDKRETSLLQTMPMEWASTILPSETAAEAATYAVENIEQAVAATSPAESAQAMPWVLADDDLTDNAPQITVLWPVTDPAKLKDHVIASDSPPETSAEAKDSPALDKSPSPSRIRPEQLAADPRLRRLLNVPVSVTVRIAEKRVNLQNVMMLTPGALLSFNKSCEDLLDLYVNNCHYGRGEAVKIGEKFGLKITEVGVTTEHHSPVIDD